MAGGEAGVALAAVTVTLLASGSKAGVKETGGVGAGKLQRWGLPSATFGEFTNMVLGHNVAV